ADLRALPRDARQGGRGARRASARGRARPAGRPAVGARVLPAPGVDGGAAVRPDLAIRALEDMEQAALLLMKEPKRRGCRCGGTCGDCKERKAAEEILSPHRVFNLARFTKNLLRDAA